jgi:hypothetical protein
MQRRTFLTALAMTAAARAADGTFPEAEIESSTIKAKLYLPDSEKGYYRATRFDWSGNMPSLKANGHEYFGQWFPKYDPKINDAIMGPVEEFITGDSALGYDEAAVGGNFVRIGVGALKKPEEKRFDRFRTYDIVDPGRWETRKGKNWIEFQHTLGNHDGYAYRYTKRIELDSSKPVMRIEHTLRNTGKKPIETDQYNHNFFMFDGVPTGPDHTVQFPFDLKPQGARPIPADLAEIQGGTIRYKQELQNRQTVFSEFTGFGDKASDYDIKVENKKVGAGVRIQGDRPITKLIYWSIRPTLCPEAYITLEAAPGKETRWTYTYTFYELN